MLCSAILLDDVADSHTIALLGLYVFAFAVAQATMARSLGQGQAGRPVSARRFRTVTFSDPNPKRVHDQSSASAHRLRVL